MKCRRATPGISISRASHWGSECSSVMTSPVSSVPQPKQCRSPMKTFYLNRSKSLRARSVRIGHSEYDSLPTLILGCSFMPVLCGTTLICHAMDDGVFLAADDLLHFERDGGPLPHNRDFRKVGTLGRVLIGSAGIMVDPHTSYRVTECTRKLSERFDDTVPQLPSVVAEAIFDDLQNTFAPSRHLVLQGAWKSYQPGGRLLSYLVAGYTKNFKSPYVFELGVEINPANDDLRFVAPFRRDAHLPQTVLIGEDKFIRRANAGHEPEQSACDEIISTVFPEILRDFPSATEALKIRLASVVGSIKLEARFNPTRVGSKVFVALTDRHQRTTLAASY